MTRKSTPGPLLGMLALVVPASAQNPANNGTSAPNVFGDTYPVGCIIMLTIATATALILAAGYYCRKNKLLCFSPSGSEGESSAMLANKA